MRVRYKELWKLLVDKKMKKNRLVVAATGLGEDEALPWIYLSMNMF